MKTNKYRRIATLLAFFMASIFSVSYAQTVEFEEDENIRSVIEHIFEHLDKERVPTGFLSDYATDIVDLSQYDGVQLVDSNYVSAEILNCILRSIRSANVTAVSPFPKVSSIFEYYSASAEKVSDIHSTNVCLAAFQYNYLPEDAVEAGKIEYTGGQVYDKFSSDGSWVNPYESAYLLAFSPLDNYLSSGRVTFRFPSGCILTNLGISSIEFDSGTGNGFETVLAGGSATVVYSEGIYDLAIRVTLRGGQVLTGHSKISVVDYRPPISLSNESALVSEHEFSYGSKPVKATVTLKRQVLGSVTKPFIIVEGFDPDLDSDYNLNNSCYLIYSDDSLSVTQPTLYSYMADKDLVCVDWQNSEASIEENGELLIQIINWVNSLKTGDEPNVVMGESMGGLVARYALRTMEISGTPHQTAIYISYDSPHQGVNIPIGAQYLAAYLYDFASNYKLVTKWVGKSLSGRLFNKPITDLLPLLDKYIYNPNTSANQMMCSHIDKSFNLSNTDHINWQNKLNRLGLPKGDAGQYITNVAFSNGSPDLYPYWSNALVNFNFTVESKWLVDLLGGTLFTDFILPFFPNAFSEIGFRTLLRLPGKYRIDVLINAASHRSKGQKDIAKFKVQFTKKLLWCIPVKIDLISYSNDAPSSVIPLDNKKGSFYSMSYHGGQSHNSLSEEDNEDIPTIGKYNYTYNIVDTFMFVPTSSALDIQATNESVYNNSSYYNNSGIIADSPFHYCYVAGRYGPNAHVAIDDSFYSKLISISNNADIEIVGDEYPHNGSTYTLSAYVKGPVTWSVDKDWARIDSNGRVSMTGQYGGTLTITASWTDDGVTHTKNKTVFLGIPKYALQEKFAWIPNQTMAMEIHDVRVSAVSSDVYFMKNAKEVKYEWGYRLATSKDITWTESDHYNFSMSSGGVFVYIYLKVKLRYFESETYSMRFIPTPKPSGPIELKSGVSVNTVSNGTNDSNVPVIYLIVNDNGSIVVTDDSGKIISEEDTHSIISSEKIKNEMNKVKPYGESAYSQSKIRLNGKDYMVRVINKNF